MGLKGANKSAEAGRRLCWLGIIIGVLNPQQGKPHVFLASKIVNHKAVP